MTPKPEPKASGNETPDPAAQSWYPITTLRRHGHDAYVEFGQKATASDVVKLLQADESVAIALAGDYGSGKSEVLHQVEAAIASTKDSTWNVVKYTPWRYAPNATTLRRTFLNEVIRGTPEFKGKPDVIRSRPETLELKAAQPRNTSPKETLGALKGPAVLFFLLSLGALAIWGALALGAQLLGYALPNGVAIVLAFAVAMATAFGDKLIRQTYDLQFETVRRHESIQTTEIDDFEEKYNILLNGLRKADPNNRLIILVDDLDRCREDEIKAVLGGLGTYLGKATNGGEVPVSFVVALDAQRTEDLLASAPNPRREQSRASWGRYNLVGKHFDAIVPVPIPSLDKWKDILIAHAAELHWKLSDGRVERLARTSAIACRFNLRELQSSIVESQLIRWHWQADIDGQDSNIQAILSDNLLLFQAALLRVSVPANQMRDFLQGPMHSAHRALGTEAKAILQQFDERGLDPRPVLAMGLASPDILQLDDLPSIAKAFENDNDNQFAEKCPTPDLNPDMALRTAYYCTRYPEKKNPNLVKKQVPRIDALLERADDLLAGTPEEVKRCLDWHSEVRQATIQQQKPDAAEVKRWTRRAYLAGPTLLETALTAGRITWDHNNLQHALQEAARLLAEDQPQESIDEKRGSVIVQAAMRAAGNAQQKHQVASLLAGLGETSNRGKIQGFGQLVVHLLKDWDVAGQNVPEWLIDQEAVGAIEHDGVQQEAALIQLKTAKIDDPHGVFDRMMKNGWKVFDEHLADSDE